MSRVLAAAAVALSLSSCAVRLPTHIATVTPPKPAPPLFEWRGDELTGPATVKINLDEQKAYIFRGGQEAGWTMLASGTQAHPTPRGSFSVIEKLEKKVSNTYGVIVDGDGDVVNWDAQAGVTPVPRGCRFVGADMPYWMRLTDGGVGMHAGDIPEPGLPASHGCIRLPREFAPTLYSVVRVGTSVTVTGSAQVAVSRRSAPGKGDQTAPPGTSGTAPSSATVASLR